MDAHNRRIYGSSGSVRVSSALFCLKMMMVGLNFVLLGVKKELGSGGINLAIGITNFVGSLTGTVVRHEANNNGWDAYAI